jgi:hypothetical protein
MSTSAITRSTRQFPLGTNARRSIERRVREAQTELLRSRGKGSQGRSPRSAVAKSAEEASNG